LSQKFNQPVSDQLEMDKCSLLAAILKKLSKS